MSANITAASLWRDCRPGGFEGLPDFVAPMGSPLAQFSVYEHYHMAAEGAATPVSSADAAIRTLGAGNVRSQRGKRRIPDSHGKTVRHHISNLPSSLAPGRLRLCPRPIFAEHKEAAH